MQQKNGIFFVVCAEMLLTGHLEAASQLLVGLLAVQLSEVK
jgi:hypothetical protein